MSKTSRSCPGSSNSGVLPKRAVYRLHSSSPVYGSYKSFNNLFAIIGLRVINNATKVGETNEDS